MTEHVTWLQEMELPEALKGGTKAMRDAGITYLPKEDGESDTAYQARLKRTFLLNTYWKTITKLSSDVFREDVHVGPELNEGIAVLLDDIDRKGNSVTQFLRVFLQNAMHKGVNHMMIEYPAVTGITKEDHKKAGARPYWVEIFPENVIGWRFEVKNDVPRLIQLRVKETVEIPDGRYGTKTKERIRLYEPGTWSVWEEGKDGWAIAVDDKGQEMQGKTSLDYIPLVTVILGDPLSRMTARPALYDLAELNLMHWQSSSDQRNILHYARLITYFGKQLDVDPTTQKIIFGANRLVHSTSPDADLKVVEHSGKGIEAGRADLKDIELAMSFYGLSLMMPRTGDTTATAKAIDKAENDSELGGWIKAIDSAVQVALKFTGKYLNIEEPGDVVKANVDFSAMIGGTESATLIECFKCGLLPRQLVIDELMARGIITGDYDLPDLVKMLEDDRRNSALLTPTLGGTFGAAGQGEQLQDQ
jgi:hypothetical protein